ncbi:DNA adenine methylase [Sphingorhabdus sp. 109]|jgi:DNA adenine methylase|uniref:DNA adenine methylase n=1 Tax=Sphingorhabdus sp. 109 TaxID=2653173 RepID=UPI0012EF2D9A|nr:Dam family site-specific DNA-(adenine-N6)-methyltransferase [Sphingorhabdus sp. 109]VWX59184.1 Site-specific DNA-methyltransferase (adenine-specific) [Sphingorhabdus sp. 109]
MHGELDSPTGKAFLRWAGGKTWLARKSDQIFRNLEFECYHEPFVGGGAFFFSLGPLQKACLSDKNEALIEVYQCLKENHAKVIEEMRSLDNTESDYYRIREAKSDCRFERAAHFVFLNQTSFNGLYRVNLKGKYNVPYGHRSKKFLDESTLESAAAALQNCTLKSCDFMDTIDDIGPGDLVFLDPPYTVSHNNNGFIKYNQSLFSLEDQYRLSKYIRIIKDLGASYILTNAAHDKVREIFEMGDNCIELDRANLIGGKRAQRGSIKELLFTNLGVF